MELIPHYIVRIKEGLPGMLGYGLLIFSEGNAGFCHQNIIPLGKFFIFIVIPWPPILSSHTHVFNVT